MAKRKIKGNTFISSQAGFTLLEVMIAIAIFAVFATAYSTGQGYNLLDSSKLKEDLILKDLCENKINDIVTNPPELRESLTISKETKDIEGYPDYQSIVEFKKFFVPDMNKITGNADSDGKEKEESPQAAMEKRIFGVFKENMEKMIWQVEVTVKNKSNSSQFKLSTWLYNQNADVKIGQF